MWIIIVIDTVVSEWLVTPGGGIMEEGKEFALLPPPPRLFYSLSLSHSDLFHIISAWLDIWKKKKKLCVWVKIVCTLFGW